jgi:DNA polymerase III sliding clamp (beta) subunit (PCNA family)
MLVDSKFPDTDAILKQAQRANVQATVSKMQLQQELRIAACFASEQYSVVKMIVGQEKITLKTSSVIGEYVGEMCIEGGNAIPSEVSLGVRLLREIIDALPSTFAMHLSDPNRPVMFTTMKDATPAGTYLLMPTKSEQWR